MEDNNTTESKLFYYFIFVGLNQKAQEFFRINWELLKDINFLGGYSPENKWTIMGEGLILDCNMAVDEVEKKEVLDCLNNMKDILNILKWNDCGATYRTVRILEATSILDIFRKHFNEETTFVEIPSANYVHFLYGRSTFQIQNSQAFIHEFSTLIRLLNPPGSQSQTPIERQTAIQQILANYLQEPQQLNRFICCVESSTHFANSQYPLFTRLSQNQEDIKLQVISQEAINYDGVPIEVFTINHQQENPY